MEEVQCFRWNNFETNSCATFRELREDNDFCDVTLACDDEQIQAHKVILSSCSSFFRGILKRNPHPHPLLYLRGINYRDLESIVNFIYKGEVNIDEDHLSSFLAVAKDLKVKGFSQNNVGIVTSKSIKEKSNANTLGPFIESEVTSAPAFVNSNNTAPAPCSGISSATTPAASKYPRVASIPNDQPSSKRLCPSINNNKSKQIEKVVPNVDKPHDDDSLNQNIGQEEINNEENETIMTADEKNQQELRDEVRRRIMRDDASQSTAYSPYNGSSRSGSIYEPQFSDESDSGTIDKVENHAAQHIEKDGTKYFCKLCRNDFTRNKSAERHVISVHLNRPIRCEKCGNEFKSSRTLQQHYEICVSNMMVMDQQL